MEGKNITIFKKVINIKKKDMDSSCYIVLESYEEKMLLTNALSYAANNTIEQMIKCKDIIEMNNLSIKREKQSSLSYKANTIKNVYMNIEPLDIFIICDALKEYKEKMIGIVKKTNCSSEDLDSSCESIYLCNKLLKELEEKYPEAKKIEE